MQKFSPFRLFAILVFVFVLVVKMISSLYVNFIWFKDLGVTQLFTTPIIAKIEIGIVSFFIYFLLIFGMALVAFKTYHSAELEEIKIKNKFRMHIVDNIIPPEAELPPISKKIVFILMLLGSIIISFFLSLGVIQDGWMKLLEFTNASNFGYADPVFGKDISFYVFKMPMYNFMLNSLTSSLLIIFLISIVAFPLTGFVRLQGGLFQKDGLHIPKSIRKFWAIVIAVLFILFALQQFISAYSVMYSQTGYVYGAGYTDINVTVPFTRIMATIALLSGLASIIYFFVNDHRLVLTPLVIYLGVAVLGATWQGLVQYNVSNNEFIKEKPFIEQEMKFTRLAYNLNNIKVKDYPGTTKLNYSNIKNNPDTIENIRLNDPKPLQTVLSQNQGLRYYYRFNDIDIDRYKLDNKYRQVLLSPREISETALTEKAGTFVNLTMRYTHGYGVVATLANEIDDTGYAKLIVKDIPPHSDTKGIDVKEPRLYYGELTNDETYGYVIGNTSAKEFDYPKGDNNAENAYSGTTGLSLTEPNKLFLSAYFSTFRFYMAGEINAKSKLLMRRNIIDRVTTIMPYLQYDHDPYIVVADNGKLYWMLDAYTSTKYFPYSAPVNGVNYIRNSVKVVIDPVDGTVNFYTFDKKDPILQTISKIFPGVFKDASTLPANLIQHIRYPEDLFNIQSNVLLNFHVGNSSVFYNKEDTWDTAKRIVQQNATSIDPYYSVMKLPEETKSEFVLMLPFTPASRQDQHRNNLVAWLAGRNDGANYGELILYKMPKEVEVQGPLMIDSLIDQDPVISGKMTLWGSGGSEVIRGNLMTVPIDGGFAYVEPIYIKAAQQGASIPQMQAIVFAIDKKLILAETKSLPEAINQFFAKEAPIPTPSGETPAPGNIKPKDFLLKKIEQLKTQLQDLEKAIRSMQ